MNVAALAASEGHKKEGALRSMFLEVLTPSDRSSGESSRKPSEESDDSRGPRSPMRRRSGILTKLSMPTLRRQSSRAPSIIQATQQPSLDPLYDLEVTNFVQTPYSKRVGDTRRSEMAQARQRMDLILDDDEDDGESIVFEWDVPDHLPNSPLCPLSPKHKSGGRAVCPLHGRRKTAPVPTSTGNRSLRAEFIDESGETNTNALRSLLWKDA